MIFLYESKNVYNFSIRRAMCLYRLSLVSFLCESIIFNKIFVNEDNIVVGNFLYEKNTENGFSI